jgi:hypothetical protein
VLEEGDYFTIWKFSSKCIAWNALTFLKPKLNAFRELYFCNTKITLEILKNQQTCDILTTWLFVISVSYKKN